MEQYGIDVSYHQGTIDWEKVKVSNKVAFSFIRVGYRGNESGTIKIDKQFKNNIQGATSQNIPVGIYFYSQAITEAEAMEEANWVCEQIKSYEIEYPVCFDFEGIGQNRVKDVTKEERMSFALTYLNHMREESYTPMMYASQNGFKTNWDTAVFVDQQIPLWCARYPNNDDGTLHPASKPEIGYDYEIWQYSCKGNIEGINGNVDLNIRY